MLEVNIKNHQEDLVLRIIDLALEEEPELRNSESFVTDVAAYVLNRIPPRYSGGGERGFRRLVQPELVDEARDEFLVQSIETLALVHHAIELVKSRRHAEAACGDDCIDEDDDGLFHPLPRLVGRLVDGEGTALAHAEVRLLQDDELVPPAGPGWLNPYKVLPATSGMFTFWPRAVFHPDDRLTHRFRIAVEAPGYEPMTQELEYESRPSGFVLDGLADGDMINLGKLVLKAATNSH